MPVKKVSIEDQILAIQKDAAALAAAIKATSVSAEEAPTVRDRVPSTLSIRSTKTQDSYSYSEFKGLFNRYRPITRKKTSTPLGIQEQKEELDNKLVKYLGTNNIEMTTDPTSREMQLYTALKSISPVAADIIKPNINPIEYIKNIYGKGGELKSSLLLITDDLVKIENKRSGKNIAAIDRAAVSSAVGVRPEIELQDENLEKLLKNINTINSFSFDIKKADNLTSDPSVIEKVCKAITDIHNFPERPQYSAINVKLKSIQQQLTKLATALPPPPIPQLKEAQNVKRKF